MHIVHKPTLYSSVVRTNRGQPLQRVVRCTFEQILQLVNDQLTEIGSNLSRIGHLGTGCFRVDTLDLLIGCFDYGAIAHDAEKRYATIVLARLTGSFGLQFANRSAAHVYEFDSQREAFLLLADRRRRTHGQSTLVKTNQGEQDDANVAQIDLVQDGLVEEVQLEFVVLAQHFLEQLGVRVQLFHAHDVLICSLELTLKVH